MASGTVSRIERRCASRRARSRLTAAARRGARAGTIRRRRRHREQTRAKAPAPTMIARSSSPVAASRIARPRRRAGPRAAPATIRRAPRPAPPPARRGGSRPLGRAAAPSPAKRPFPAPPPAIARPQPRANAGPRARRTCLGLDVASGMTDVGPPPVIAMAGGARRPTLYLPRAKTRISDGRGARLSSRLEHRRPVDARRRGANDT